MTEQEAIKFLEKYKPSEKDGDLSELGYKFKSAYDMSIKALKMQILENADGCKGCAFENVNEWEMPCAKCKRNSKDYWRAKRGNEDAE